MRILLVHNYYKQPGGEDRVFEAEAHLLETYGHHVLRYTAHNDELDRRSAPALARDTLWNRSVAKALTEICRRERPSVVHFHNTFPLISPAAYHAVRSTGIPTVQTLHNYRILCPAATFFRDGKVCEECLGRQIPWPGVVHACYRSRTAVATVSAMVTAHRMLRTWKQKVSRYIALTEFARHKFIEGGVPAEQVAVKPNFVAPDPGMGTHQGNYALFVGRLSPEKGIRVLLDAWSHLAGRIPLKIVGDGPLASLLQQSPPGVEWLGQKTREDVLSLMKGAVLLVFPSEWYETFGLTIVEAFATGLPVVASRLGSAAELVEDGSTGLHFRAGDATDLAERVNWAVARPSRLVEMGECARREYLDKFTAPQNYRMLTEIYRQVVAEAAA